MTPSNQPARIASLLASATEMLYAVGAGERVVAVSHECDWPVEVAGKPRVTQARIDSSAASGAIDAQVKELLAAGGPLYEIDERALVELAPELIVTQAQCDVCAVRYEDVLTAVARHPALRGAQVVALNPTSLAEVLADLERVGRAAGCAEGAERCVVQLTARIDAVAKGVAADVPLLDEGRADAATAQEAIRPSSSSAQPATLPRVALIEWIEPLMLSGNWLPEAVALAGGEHALTQAGAHSPYVDWNTLLDYDPEVLLVMPCGFDLSRTLTEISTLTAKPGWSQLAAVRAGRVFAVDGNAYFNRSGPRLVDSLEILGHLIHPELVPVPKCVSKPEQVWQRIVD